MGLLSVLFERPPATIVPPAGAPASVEDIALPHALDAETYDDPVTSHAVRCLEADILAVIQSVSLSAESGRTLILEMQGEIDRIRNGMVELVDQGRHAADDAAALAWNSSQIASASRQVSHVFTTTQSEFVEVAQAASQTTGLLAELARATDEISGIVQAIAGVANQTKLLALNASIEAARAGAAGRGFAVVANEVRNLSIETSGSANDIAQRIARLNASARTSIVAVERILAAIQRVKPHFETVDGSMETQIAAIVELAQRAAKNSQFVNSVCETAGQIDLATSNATHRIAETRQVAENTADIANDLGRRFVVAFRETPFGNRRTERRYPVNLQAEIQLPGGTRPLRCIDISRRGLRLHLDAASKVEWSGARPIEIETLGEAEIRLVSRSETSLHCEFVGMGAEVSDRIDALISRLDGDYDKLIILMQDTASQISGCFVQALRTGRISENDLFDMNYLPVPDTDPEQFTTRALPFLEEVLPPIQEPMLAMDPKIVFCTAVDINGWLPVHHAACSLPQRRGDRAWNIANCRNRRFYDFRHGIFAARAMRPFIIKSYLRDLGGGEPVILASVDVPLRVLGQNWGGVRMGYSL